MATQTKVILVGSITTPVADLAAAIHELMFPGSSVVWCDALGAVWIADEEVTDDVPSYQVIGVYRFDTPVSDVRIDLTEMQRSHEKDWLLN